MGEERDLDVVIVVSSYSKKFQQPCVSMQPSTSAAHLATLRPWWWSWRGGLCGSRT